MRNFLFVLACIAILPITLAFDESSVVVQDNVYLLQDMTVPIKIENNSLQDKELKVEFIGPSSLYYEFANLPSEIKASQNREIELYLSPSVEMEGTTYNSTLIVKLGNETTLKEIKLHVSKMLPEETIMPQEQEKEPEKQGFFPFAFLGSIEGITTFVLSIIVIVLAIVFIARLWSKKKKRGGLIE